MNRIIFDNLTVLCQRPLLVFSVTPFKINQNKNQNWEMKGDTYTKTLAKIQVRGIFRIRDIYPKKCFTQTYRDLYGDAMLVLTLRGNQQKHLLPSFATKA